MLGCVALRGGVLYVARHEQTGHVRPYDLDGRPLSVGISFRGTYDDYLRSRGIAIDLQRAASQ
jgi:hypothetical protein